MRSALIGFTGFVGSNLDRQHGFDDKFNSRNIGAIEAKSYDLVVCAGVQAKKWWANEHPAEDWAAITSLLDRLAHVQADRFVLVSTVDVYPHPRGVDETTVPDETANHAYGRHRYQVEEFVRERFPNHLVLRLPGLFGPGLKKNVIFDLLTDNNLEKINPDGSYQYYDLGELWGDLSRLMATDIRLINFATAPLTTREIIDAFFPGKDVGGQAGPAGSYDFRTIHADRFGGQAGYLKSQAQVRERLGRFIDYWKAGGR